MKIVLLGATGGTGRAFLRKALEAGHQVRCIARTPSKLALEHEGLEVVQGDVREPESLETGFAGQDVVVGAFGIAGLGNAMKATDLYSAGGRGVIAAMKKVGLKRFVMLTAGGVLYMPEAPFVWNRIIRPLCWRMYADMAQLEVLIAESGLDWTVLRPPQLTDGPARGVWQAKHDATPEGATKLSREDLATLLLQEVEEGTYLHQRAVIMG